MAITEWINDNDDELSPETEVWFGFDENGGSYLVERRLRSNLWWLTLYDTDFDTNWYELPLGGNFEEAKAFVEDVAAGRRELLESNEDE